MTARKYKSDQRKYRSDNKAPPTKEKHHPQWGFLIKDNEARLESTQLLWNKEKQGEGKILENITLIRPHIKLGKAKYWLLFPQNFISSHVIYLVLLKGGWLSSFGFLQSKALSGHFAETTLACPFQSPARRVLSPAGTAPRYYIKPGNLLVVTYSHLTHPSWVCIRWVSYSVWRG